MTQESAPQPQPTAHVPVKRRPRKSAEFSEDDRREFVRLLETATARSKTEAAALIRVSPTTVERWLAVGKRDEDWYTRRLGPEAGTLAFYKNRKCRQFFLSVQQALARGAAIADVVLVEAALGKLVEVEDPTTGLRTQVREGGDWRAADALAKRQERMDLHPVKKRLLESQAEKETHAADAARELARRAKADADRAEVLADAARKAARGDVAAVVFTPTFLAALEAKDPALFASLTRFMESSGFAMATPEQAERAVAERDDAKDAEMLRLAADWGMDVDAGGEDAEPPQGDQA